MNRKSEVRTLAHAVAATLIAAASLNAVAQKIVRIGVPGPYSGALSNYGSDVQNGVRLAIEDANSANIKLGGMPVKFELVAEDDAGDPKQAVNVATTLVDKKVAGIVGHLTSGTTIPASDVYNAALIPQISPSATNAMFTRKGYKTAFRVIGDDLQVGAALARYMVVKLGHKSVAVIDDRTAYGQGLATVVANSVASLGGTVQAREYTSATATDFRAILTSIKPKKVTAIFYGGQYSQAAGIRRQMKEIGIDAALFGSSIASEEYVNFAGKEVAEGTISGDSGQAIENMPGGPAFLARFKEKFGPVVLYAPYGYDAAMALIDAMKAADSADPAKYLPAISSLQFNGVTGPIAFDEKGDLKSASVTFSQVRGGRWVPLETVTAK